VSGPTASIRVWDLPVRLFHWGIAILVGISWVAERVNWMQLHFLSGYTILTALLFRLAWGFVGSDTARFSRFLRSPLAAIRHLSRLHRHEADTEMGHNAASGWMVLLLLVLLAVQAASGLGANDDVSVEGPLAKHVGKQASDWLSHIHAVNFTLIKIAVLLHLLAIAAYALVKRHDLVRPMITGMKQMPAGMPAPRMASAKLAILLFAIAAGAVAVLANRL